MNACATAQGIAYCWGNDNGPIAALLPTALVTDKPVVRIATTWGRSNTYDPQRACMIDVDGDVYCFGANAAGQVGDGTKDYALTPKKVAGLPAPAADIALGIRTSCALLVDGRVLCWGDDTNGQLGSGKIKVPTLAPGEVKLP